MRRSWLWPVIIFALLCPVYAQEDHEDATPACVSPEIVLDQINKQTVVVRHIELTPEQSVRVVAWYNKLPPESDEKWNYVVLFQTPVGLGLLFGNDKLVCDGMKVKRDQVEDLLKAIAGGEDI